MDAVTNMQAALVPFVGLRRNYYGAVLADPPWRYLTWSPKGQGRSPSRHYNCMSFDEIAALPVASIAARDCWLFLWAPSQHHKNAMRLMELWGFGYSSTGFVWKKTRKDGTGYVTCGGKTTRKSTEICWLGRRGKPPVNSRGTDELIEAPRREHSRKPDEQYPRIEEFCDGPYAELFARQQWSGWDAWGDQLQLNLFGGRAA